VIIKRLKTPLDLKGIHGINSLNFIKIPSGRRVFVEKIDEKITFLSPNNQNMSNRCKLLSEEIRKINIDFSIDCILVKDNEIVVIDVLKIGDEKYNNKHAERIKSISCLFKSKNIKKPERTVLKSLTETIHGSYKVIVDAKPSPITYLYESDMNLRNVIISSYYYGNKVDNERETLFKCHQVMKERTVYVGKLRLSSEIDRKKAVAIIKKKKRLVANVQVDFDKRNSKKYSKLNFVRFLSDEKFKDIVVDDELFFSPIQIFSIGSKKSRLYYLVEENKNLNTITGAI
jgi:hypothetical protein